MKYFISGSGEVFAYEDDGSQDEFIRDGLSPLSADEFEAIQAKDSVQSDDQKSKSALLMRDELLMLAGIRIAPLQDAIDFGSATDAQKSEILGWKRYRVALSEVPSQAGFPSTIQWPEQPS